MWSFFTALLNPFGILVRRLSLNRGSVDDSDAKLVFDSILEHVKSLEEDIEYLKKSEQECQRELRECNLSISRIKVEHMEEVLSLNARITELEACKFRTMAKEANGD